MEQPCLPVQTPKTALQPMLPGLVPALQEEVETVTTRRWRSSSYPEIAVEVPRDRAILEWAEANPQAYKIVRQGSRSKAFGPGSCVYIGWAQKCAAPEAVLERLRTLHNLAHSMGFYQCFDDEHIMCWRARYTLRFYGRKGFSGGIFTTMQPGRKSSLDILTLDFTPETVEQVAARFARWARQGDEQTRVVVWKDGRPYKTALQDWSWRELRGWPCELEV